MKQLRTKPRRTAGFYAVTALCVVTGLAVAVSGIRVFRLALTRFSDNFFHPYLKLAAPSGKLADSSLLLRDKAELAAAVERLSAVNRELALGSQTASALLEENRQLRNLLDIGRRENREFIIGEILLRDPLHFRENFTVGKGRLDGVLPGAAVVEVSSGGELLLVGVVSEAGGRSCKVTTVANSFLRISGKVASNGVIGFTHSGEATAPHGRISFGMLPLRQDYVHGCVVSTTGFEYGIPEGIKIGELYTTGARRSYADEDYSCELIPSAGFGSLRFVAIVRLPGLPEEQPQ